MTCSASFFATFKTTGVQQYNEASICFSFPWRSGGFEPLGNLGCIGVQIRNRLDLLQSMESYWKRISFLFLEPFGILEHVFFFGMEDGHMMKHGSVEDATFQLDIHSGKLT